MPYLFFLGHSTNSQMLGCVVRTENKAIAIDGGTRGDAESLACFIKEHAQSHIDAWFFTHPHHDHIGAFVEICKRSPEIKIEKTYSHFPSVEMLRKYEYRTEEEHQMWIDFAEANKGCHQTVHAGEIYTFDEVTITVIRTFNPMITSNFTNNSSTVFRIDGPNKSVLILGDLGVEGGQELMNTVPAEVLFADYTQMAHHGQNGVDYQFYEYIHPNACLWAAPDWLYNNDLGKGFDTGPLNTVRTREWMETLGVKEHIVQKDGTTRISI